MKHKVHLCFIEYNYSIIVFARKWNKKNETKKNCKLIAKSEALAWARLFRLLLRLFSISL